MSSIFQSFSFWLFTVPPAASVARITVIRSIYSILFYYITLSLPVIRFCDRSRCFLKPGTHWRQSWIQHGRLCWKSTKSTLSLWPRTHWLQSRPHRQQSRPRQAVELTLLPICCQNRQQRWTYTATVDFVAGFGNSRLSTNSTVLNLTLSPVCTGL